MPKPKLTLLTEPDEAFFEQCGGNKWMRGRPFRRGPARRYEEALTALAESLRQLGLDVSDGQALQELLAVMLSRDTTFGPWFRDRNVNVADPDTFERLCRCTAGAVVRDFLYGHPQPEGADDVVEASQLAGHVEDLVNVAISRGELSAEEGRQAGESRWTIDGRADLGPAAPGRLEALLLSETNVAHEADPDVPELEREREIAKSALLQLKLTQLRRLAEENDIPALRDQESLAELITLRYNANRTEIAELVLHYSTPDVERGWATRIVPLEANPDIEQAKRRAATMRGKYLRLGVATWFVTGDVNLSARTVAVGGEVRYYSVRPQREGQQFDIAAQQRSHPVAVRIRDDLSWAQIDGHSAADVRRLRKLLRFGLGVKTQRLDVNVPALAGEAALWNPTTIRLLHIIDHGIRDDHLDFDSLRRADFTRVGPSELEPQHVAVRAVRLQGQHIMADPAACRYITDGETLSSVDIRVSWRANLRDEKFYTTVRVGLAEDHAFLLTAFGGDQNRSRALHEELVRRLRRGLEAELQPDALSALIEQIVNRARDAAPPENVDIWGPTPAVQDAAVASEDHEATHEMPIDLSDDEPAV